MVLLKIPHFVIAMLAVLLMPLDISAQSNISSAEKTVTVQKFDMTGKSPIAAIRASLSASSKDVVVVMICGSDQGLIDETEGTMKALIHGGYERIGLIFCDTCPDDETPPIITIYSKGWLYATIRDQKNDAHTHSDIYKLVRDAYKEDMLPIKTESQSSGGEN